VLPSLASRDIGGPNWPPSAPESGEGPFVRDGAPVRFLIVEDEAVIAMDLETMVSESGGQPVGMAATAAEAERLAAALAPDVILMDVRLKGARDGIAAAEAIREAHGIPIVFVTGNEEATTLGRIRGFNGSSPVPKPVRAPALVQAVLAALQGATRGTGPH
jgi:CheY-like chemotaxis protein